MYILAANTNEPLSQAGLISCCCYYWWDHPRVHHVILLPCLSNNANFCTHFRYLHNCWHRTKHSSAVEPYYYHAACDNLHESPNPSNTANDESYYRLSTHMSSSITPPMTTLIGSPNPSHIVDDYSVFFVSWRNTAITVTLTCRLPLLLQSSVSVLNPETTPQ